MSFETRYSGADQNTVCIHWFYIILSFKMSTRELIIGARGVGGGGGGLYTGRRIKAFI